MEINKNINREVTGMKNHKIKVIKAINTYIILKVIKIKKLLYKLFFFANNVSKAPWGNPKKMIKAISIIDIFLSLI